MKFLTPFGPAGVTFSHLYSIINARHYELISWSQWPFLSFIITYLQFRSHLNWQHSPQPQFTLPAKSKVFSISFPGPYLRATPPLLCNVSLGSLGNHTLQILHIFDMLWLYFGLKSFQHSLQNYNSTVHDPTFRHSYLVPASGAIILTIRSLFILMEPLLTLSLIRCKY